MAEAAAGRGSRAVAVAAGILASRLTGFVREMVIAHYFGVGPHADVYRVAFRGPNVLQNLLGEGTLSAAFIPVYSRLLHEGRRRDAGRFAGAVLGLLMVLVSALVLLGMAAAPLVVRLLAWGFTDDPAAVAAGAAAVDRFALTVQGVRLIFPMTGILVISAWALAVLNSHRRFFVPYVAPVLWNLAIVAALVAGAWLLVPDGGAAPPAGPAAFAALDRLLMATFVGALVGGILQLAVQLPWVVREIEGFRFAISWRMPEVREAVRAFGPVVAGRGAYQLSAWIDLFLASFLAAGALGALGYAQTLYLLPVGLFAMSVAASELPELSRLREDEVAPFLDRVSRSLRQILFLTLPTVIGYLAFGWLLVRALFERGRFGPGESWLVTLVLAAYALGLFATTATRLLQNAFYALRDTRTPARIAVARVLASTAAAVPLMFWLDRFSVEALTGAAATGEPLFLGACGLALGASLGAWLELGLLAAKLRRRVGLHLPWPAIARMGGLALAAAAAAGGAWYVLPDLHLVLLAVAVVGLFAALYLGAAWLLHFPELATWMGRLARRRG